MPNYKSIDYFYLVFLVKINISQSLSGQSKKAFQNINLSLISFFSEEIKKANLFQKRLALIFSCLNK